MAADERSADEERGGRGGEAAQRRQRQAVGQQRILKRRHGKRPDRVDNLRKTTARHFRTLRDWFQEHCARGKEGMGRACGSARCAPTAAMGTFSTSV